MFVASENRGEKAGFIAMAAVNSVDKKSVQDFSNHRLHEDQYIATDAYPSLKVFR